MIKSPLLEAAAQAVGVAQGAALIASSVVGILAGQEKQGAALEEVQWVVEAVEVVEEVVVALAEEFVEVQEMVSAIFLQT